MRTIKFYTLGCKVNQYDTQSIREQFACTGFKEIDGGSPADICVINTCTVTHKADSESFGIIRKAKHENPGARIVVTGCLAELDAQKVKSAEESVIIVRNKDKKNILNRLDFLPPKKYGLRAKARAITAFKGHTRVFLKIQDGCNNMCSYCRVPLARGRSKSRALKGIMQEARSLVRNGFKEIVLTGICLGGFGRELKNRRSLVELIEELEGIEGLERIRLSSIEAGDVSGGIIDKMSQSPRLCRHLHIPIQSGDNAILKKMRRSYTREYYLDLIMRIRRKVPDVSITTDCLVGFPGETDENFMNTVNLIKEILPLKAHIFPYSKRQGTLAAHLAGQLPPEVIRERAGELKKAADECSFKFQRGFLGREVEVLFESESKAFPGFFEGHSGNYLKVLLRAGQEIKNKLIPVRLKELKGGLFLGDKVYKE